MKINGDEIPNYITLCIKQKKETQLINNNMNKL